MRILAASVFIGLFLTPLVSCERKEKPLSAATATTRPASTSASPILPRPRSDKDEAVDLVQNRILPLFTIIGENYITRARGSGDEPTFLTELSGVSWLYDEHEITDVDRLNGLQWSGNVIMCAKALREYHGFADTREFAPGGGPFLMGWTAWHSSWNGNYVMQYRCIKTNGTWQVSPLRPSALKGDPDESRLQPPALTSLPPLDAAEALKVLNDAQTQRDEKIAAMREKAFADALKSMKDFFQRDAVVHGFIWPSHNGDKDPFDIQIVGDFATSDVPGDDNTKKFSVPGHFIWTAQPMRITPSGYGDKFNQWEGVFSGSITFNPSVLDAQATIKVEFYVRDRNLGGQWVPLGTPDSLWNGTEFGVNNADRFYKTANQ